MLTDQHISIIKKTLPLLEQADGVLTVHFYQRMFKESLDFEHIFNMFSLPNGGQQVALFGAISAYVKHIEDLADLTSAVERFVKKQASLAIKAEHYDIVSDNLIKTLCELAPKVFTPTVEEAWREACKFLTQIFVDHEAKLYKQRIAKMEAMLGQLHAYECQQESYYLDACENEK